MKIKSTNLGDKYTFKNKFSKNRISKNDLYMNKFLKLKYKVGEKVALVSDNGLSLE